MAIHVCRDFWSRNIAPPGTGSNSDISAEGVAAYFLTIFMMGTLGWSVIAETASDFAARPGAGAVFTGGTIIGSSSILVSCGSGGSLNLGPGFEYRFEPPSGSHRFDVISGSTASGSFLDTGRILVLRSEANPMLNSGLFRITNVHPETSSLDATVGGAFASGTLSGGNGAVWSGSFSIDYRSSQFPPSESGTLTWHIFQDERELTSVGIDPSPPSVSTSDMIGRLVLQSPTSSWQLKLENEPDSTDGPGGSTPARVTIAPGFSANSGAQYPIAGEHLHGPRWFNSNNFGLAGSAVGLEFVDNAYLASGSTTNTGSIRTYMWGSDDAGLNNPGSVVVIWRNGPSPPNNLRTTWRAFGFCEDEPSPLPPKTIHRMFAMGGNSTFNHHQTQLQWDTTRSGDLESGTSNDSGNSIVGFGLNNRPALGNISTWCFLLGQTDAKTSNPRQLLTASHYPTTSSFTREFELLPVDIMMETWDTRFEELHTSSLFTLNGRRLGRFPIARYGVDSFHADLSDWAITNDTRWIHTEDGIYLPWSGSL